MSDAVISPSALLTTVLTDDFEPGYLVFLGSLLEHNPWFDLEIRILWHPETAPLSDDVRRRCRMRYPKTTFAEVPSYGPGEVSQAFMAMYERTGPAWIPALNCLYAMSFDDVDRVVALDSDMLVTGDLRALFTGTADFAAVEAHHRATGPRGFFNGGLMVFAGDHLGPEAFDRLRRDFELPVDELFRDGPGEQGLVNAYFRDDVSWLPQKYNVQKRFVPDDTDVEAELRRIDTRILHYVGSKPWQTKPNDSERVYRTVEAMWLEAFRRYATPEDEARLLAHPNGALPEPMALGWPDPLASRSV